jgi:cell division inhibitor SepF
LKKTMVYLGLVDDEYDDYDDYDDRTASRIQPVARSESRTAEPEEPETRLAPTPVGRIRPLPRDNGTVSTGPVAVRPQSIVPRAISPDALTKVHVVAPARFGDAKEIADCLKQSRPVIVNLTVAERDLQRRMIDFCSGVTYALSGEMEKVADQVFLLTPTNVKVSDEERQRLQERNFGRH